MTGGLLYAGSRRGYPWLTDRASQMSKDRGQRLICSDLAGGDPSSVAEGIHGALPVIHRQLFDEECLTWIGNQQPKLSFWSGQTRTTQEIPRTCFGISGCVVPENIQTLP